MIRTWCLPYSAMATLLFGFVGYFGEPAPAAADNVHMNVYECGHVQRGSDQVRELLRIEQMILELLTKQIGQDCAAGPRKGGQGKSKAAKGGGKDKGGNNAAQGGKGKAGGAKGKGGNNVAQGGKGKGKAGGGGKGKGGGGFNQGFAPFQQPNNLDLQLHLALGGAANQFQPRNTLASPLNACFRNPNMQAAGTVGARGGQPKNAATNQRKK